MAAHPESVIITEAYSAKNAGDAELVYATLAEVVATYPGALTTVVALEPGTFSAEGTRFVPRLFDRHQLAGAPALARSLWLLRWAAFVLLESTRAVRGARGPSALSARLVGARAADAYAAYVSADAHVPVGGGYLGDRYVKESALTLWTWWWTTRRGASFTTMPISIEAHGPLMRVLLRRLVPRRGVTVRDEASRTLMSRLGVEVRVRPDLAFRHVRHHGLTLPLGSACWVFPVGSDYFPEHLWRQQWSVVLRACEQVAPSVKAASMHVALDAVRAGGDEEVVQYLASSFPGVRAEAVGNYQDLVSTLACDARVVVTARMHAGIAALCAGVPVVLIGYEEKHRTLMQRLEMEDAFLPLAELTAGAFEAALEAAVARSRLDIYAAVRGFIDQAGA